MPSTDADHLGAELLSLPYRDRQLIAVVQQGASPIEHVEINLRDYVNLKTFSSFFGWKLFSKEHSTDPSMKAQRTERLAVVKKLPTKKFWTDELPEEVMKGLTRKKNELTNTKNWGLSGYVIDKLRQTRKPSAGGSIRHLRTIRADIAESIFLFPPGHPLYETAYAGHPLKPSVYVPLATFHRFLFEEKVNELLTLLWCLRASRVTIHYVRGYRDAFEAGGGLSVPVEIPVDVRASVEHTRSHRSEATLEAYFTPMGEAHIPQATVWYAHESTWRKIAEARLSAGLRAIDVELRYDDDFGIGGEIATTLTGIGLRLGGEFQKHERTVWKFHGSFE